MIYLHDVPNSTIGDQHIQVQQTLHICAQGFVFDPKLLTQISLQELRDVIFYFQSTFINKESNRRSTLIRRHIYSVLCKRQTVALK